ncbi:hypothetical protein KIPB_012552, partial [Kipferlia bialata]|eukprot:g12552.t1
MESSPQSGGGAGERQVADEAPREDVFDSVDPAAVSIEWTPPPPPSLSRPLLLLEGVDVLYEVYSAA